MQDIAVTIGVPAFFASFVRQGQTKEVRIAVGIPLQDGRGYRSVDVFGGKAELDADTALGRLCDAWHLIAGPYADGPERGEFDLASLAKQSTAPFRLSRLGPSIYFPDACLPSMGSDSPICIEVLITLAELLAETADSSVTLQWKSLRSQTALPAFPAEDRNFTPYIGGVEAEARWYAEALDQDYDDYRRAAFWAHARQTAFAIGLEGHSLEPHGRLFDSRVLPADLPPDQEIERLIEVVSNRLGATSAEIKEQALAARNMDARQVTVFRRFFPTQCTGLTKPDLV